MIGWTYWRGLMTLASFGLSDISTVAFGAFLSRTPVLVKQACHVSFFFQGEDGIRDYKVTGVQTCALPISRRRKTAHGRESRRRLVRPDRRGRGSRIRRAPPRVRTDESHDRGRSRRRPLRGSAEIGRGSGRERGEISVVVVDL